MVGSIRFSPDFLISRSETGVRFSLNRDFRSERALGFRMFVMSCFLCVFVTTDQVSRTTSLKFTFPTNCEHHIGRNSGKSQL